MYKILIITTLSALSLSCDSTKRAVESTNTASTIESVETNQNSSSVEVEYLDLSVRPQDDFFRFANGTWVDNNPVPASESRWGSFNELEISNNKKLTSILEDAKSSKALKGSDLQILGDYYASFIDIEKRKSLGTKPIQSEIDEIMGLTSKDQIIDLIAKHHQLGIPSLFNFYVGQDLKDIDSYIIYISQGGIGLPNKDYYVGEDKSKIYDAYQNYIINVLQYTKIENPKEKTASIVKFESQLADAMMTPTELRVPENTYNKFKVDEIDSKFKSLGLKSYLSRVGVDLQPKMEFILGQPEFAKRLNQLFEEASLEEWKNYLLWKVLNHYAPQLDKAMIVENFNFYGKVLTGKSEMKPLNELAIKDITDSPIGELLGKVFVGRHFSETARDRVNKMVDNLLLVFGERIDNLDWMTDKTKEQAQIKLNAIGRKLGYPSKYEDFSSLNFSANDLVENNRELARFAWKKNISKLGQKIDRDEWEMPAHLINAYYNPLLNEIAFPAGIMQAPFFSEEYDDAINYGRIGMVIGHEFTHGFDDMGSKFASDGSFTNWWSEEDRKSFEERTGKLGKTFDDFCPIDGHCVNSSLTMGENIADLGGLTMAYYAYTKTKEFKENKVINGFTSAQRFFIAYAQLWKINYTQEELKNRIANDPHSPGMYRVNGPLMNSPEFFEAFDVKESDKMRNSASEVSKIW